MQPASGNNSNANAGAGQTPAPVPAPAPAAGNANSGAAAAGNLQTFTETLGGVEPPVVTTLANGQFQVDGNAAFANKQNALIRSW